MNRLGLILFAALPTMMACGAGAATPDRDAFLARQIINCPGCDLAGANLDRRDLTGADLSGADLRGATFSRAVFRGANFINDAGREHFFRPLIDAGVKFRAVAVEQNAVRRSCFVPFGSLAGKRLPG